METGNPLMGPFGTALKYRPTLWGTATSSETLRPHLAALVSERGKVFALMLPNASALQQQPPAALDLPRRQHGPWCVPTDHHLPHTHHSGQAGDVLDRILHLLLRHLDEGAVLILCGQQLRSVLGDPRVQLQLITQPVRNDFLFFVTQTTQAWQTHLLAQTMAPTSS